MTVTFNLVDEPWIPVIWRDGRAGEVGLRDALVHAHEIRELVDGSPLVTVSLHRLLLAILHRNLGPRTFTAWKELWKRGQWDAAKLDAYFAAWGHRFDLFDAERPFYQVTQMDDNPQVHPPARLAEERAQGNNATLFDHNFRSSPVPMSAADAARCLVTRQTFAVGGGKSEPFYFCDAPAVVGFVVMAAGTNFFETLALNLTEYGSGHRIALSEQDAPIWEQEIPATPERSGTRPRGPVDYLTWQSRRIRLLADGDPPVVVGCQFAQGLRIDPSTLDSMKPYTRSQQEGWVARRLDPDRALWRDSHAILQESDAAGRRPDVFNWLARIDEARLDGDIEARSAYEVTIGGLARNPRNAADVLFWRHERFTVPLAYLHDESLLGKLAVGLTWAENVGRLLRPGLEQITIDDRRVNVPRPFQVLAEALLPSVGGRPDRKRVDAVIGHLAPERRYWSKLEVSFRHLLEALPDDQREDEEYGVVYGEQTLPEWAARLRAGAWDAFQEATRGLDRSARALEAVALAERELGRRLHQQLGVHLPRRKEPSRDPTN